MGAFLNYCLLMDVLIVTFKNSSLPAHIDHVIGSSSFGYNPTTISAHHHYCQAKSPNPKSRVFNLKFWTFVGNKICKKF